MSKEFRFSWVYPKYSEELINDSHWHLPNKGRPMDGVDDIRKINPKEGSTEKSELPWLQLFEESIRIGTDNVDWSKWNGCTWADIDSKLYYNNVKQFIPKQLYGALMGHFKEKYANNFIGMQFSNSTKGYHILFYFDVERNYENFVKCSMWTRQCVYDTFCAVGASDIITYKKGKSKVLDTCASSPFQGIYLTSYKWTFGWINLDDFGKIENLDEISISQAAQLTNINNIPLYVDDKPTFEIKSIREVDKSEINYYSHPYRRSIYEALITLYRNKDEVDSYWSMIASMIPSENGHDSNFYLNEPTKNKWFSRYNQDTYHSVRILKTFGWNIDFKNGYIFRDEILKNWKNHCKYEVVTLFMNLKHNMEEIKKRANEIFLEDENDRKIEECMKAAKIEFRAKYKNNTIFDIEFDYLKNQEYTEKLQEYRDCFYKEKFEVEDFPYICKYKLNEDSLSIQYFADIYYRNENNFPSVKYDILDDVMWINSFDKETIKKKWHTLSTNDEYVIWHNSDVYSGKLPFELFRKSVQHFVSNNFGFNDLKDYLNGLDTSIADVEKLETFYIRYLDVKDNPLNRKITKNWYIAAVKKQLEEEVFVFPHMLTLFGETGCGKSYINVAMFTINKKQYYTENIDVTKDDKDNGPLIRRNWLVLWNEGKGLSNKDNEANKRFMDKVNANFAFQKKFENDVTIVQPRCVVAYTTNNKTIYSDASVVMDRRSWLLECCAPANSMTEEKRKAILEEKDMIWATALKLYLDNPEQNLELDDDENKMLAKVQDEHQMIDRSEIDEWIQDYLDRPYQLSNLPGSDIPVFISESSFNEQINIRNYKYSTPIPDNINSSLIQFDRIPTLWISNLLKTQGKNNSFATKLYRRLEELNWVKKTAGYPTWDNIKSTKKCWCRSSI